MDISQYLEIFIEESKEHLQLLNESLLNLEKDPANIELVNEIFRVAHTLKGMSGTMGYKRMQKLTHDMENVLAEIRNEKIKTSANLLDVLFQSLDALEEYVDTIVNTGTEGENDNEKIIAALNAILNEETEEVVADKKPEVKISVETEGQEDASLRKHKELTITEYEESAILKAYNENYKVYGLTIYIQETCILKSARAFIIFRTLENLGQVIKSNPSVQEIEDENFDNDFSVFLVSNETPEKIYEEIRTIAEVSDVLLDEVSLEDAKIEDSEEKDDILEEINLVKDTKKDIKKEEQQNSNQNNKPKTNRTVRVDIERLDNLMNLVSELIIIKNGLETIDVDTQDQNFNESIEYLERVTTNLHDAVMKVRMVPIERVFNRFPRMIRDLSRKLDKNIELNITGEDTELDRTVIDEIGDPLVHLLRNAADHGLETKNERAKTGKDEQGIINLTAYQDGNNVVIEVEDDGKGIDTDKVKEKAVSKGVISPEVAEAMTENEAIELLFKPSFSTAGEISDVSGRGVGLDVVKTKIETLGGDIEVRSTLGIGSKFIIRLPLTLAIIQALMVNLGQEKYAIPLNTIQTIEDIKKDEIKYVQSKEVIHLRGSVIPLVRLNEELHVTKEENEEVLDYETVVIVNKGDRKAGFVVDSLIGQQEIVIKSLGKYLINIKMIAGATILGDGEVALILDVNTLV
ncbi:two-component system chemotaxis sensor kinase CheA [Natranaerovirga hydrolytica]|uniref:Chemotaxis protein CheA n=1 Tax=Natranaerovirga hydrolytica TaxID=680378 RepID=A0A4R1N1P0_9FIRM|nr:chemotaxis protein CheA [Natranaerovirga hydrolytica]TCK97914.1 two-component system chemotaxis sensor kinase CheA [Natranaerovirga hydrolytica]